MKHDELITKLNTAYVVRDVDDIYNLHRALRAVVELHKPNEYSNNKYCNCEEPYPCPTILLIEKEM